MDVGAATPITKSGKSPLGEERSTSLGRRSNSDPFAQ